MFIQQLFQFFQKNSYVVTCSVAGIIFLLTQWLTRRRTATKSFGWHIITDYVMLSKREQHKDRVKILFDDKPIEDVRLVIIELKNTGGKEIVPSDFYRPITITFPQGSELLDVGIASKSPESFDPEVESDKTIITLKPSLMNKDDTVTISAIVTSMNGIINVKGRIAGISEISKLKPNFLMSEGGMRRTLIGLMLVFTIISITNMALVMREMYSGRSHTEFIENMNNWKASQQKVKDIYDKKLAGASVSQKRELIVDEEITELSKNRQPIEPDLKDDMRRYAIGTIGWIFIMILLYIEQKL